jgi:D-aspartate ligase
MRPTPPPAVVVGADINGLGVVRSLAREQVPVFLVDTDRSHPSMRTRYARKITFPALAGPALVGSLLALRERFACDPVLFLTQEATVEAVSGAMASIATAFRISMPAAPIMQQLMDKAQFQMLAQGHGFAVPRAVHLRRAEDLARADMLDYPCILKPVTKTPAYVRRFKRAYKVENPTQLRAIFSEIDGAAEMIAQEWIEGGDEQIYFCLQYRPRDSGASIGFSGRKLRSWPPETGGTASCLRAAEHGDEIARLTRAFFDAVGFFGIGSMEFKRDTRTGQFLMIEPTVGRTDYQEEVATLNGVNIPYAVYCGEIGRSAAPPRPTPRAAAWAVNRVDRWSADARPDRRRDFPRGVRRYDALWRADDPLPWCCSTGRRVAARIASLKPLLGRSPDSQPT